MATYEEIYGKRVDVLDSDPTLSSAYEGQVWYNSASGALKTVVSSATWSSSNSMVNGRPQCSGTGTVTAGLAAGTYPPAVGSYGGANQTEEYNGTGWSVGGDMSNGKADLNTFGPQTAAFAAGGDAHPTNPRGSTQVEEYDGSSWTSAPALPQGSYEGGGCASNGSATSALVLGGRTGPPSAISNVTQTWNGSAWGTGGTYPSTIQGSFVFGQSNPTMISAGGYNGTAVQGTAFTYDGSNWTAINSMQDGRYVGVGSGTPSSGLLYGGASGSPDTRRQTETYDGTTFSVGSLMTNPRNSMAGSKIAGTTAFAGSVPGVTEEYQVSINTITAAAWAAGTASSTGRYIASGVGSNTAAVVYGGVFNPGSSLKNETEEWNGTSWSEQSDLSTARFGIGQGIGTQTAALAYGGYTTTIVSSVEEYNGASWTAGTSMPAANRIQGGFGTQTAGVSAAGQGAPGKWTNSYEYNGASWTSATAYPTAVEQMAGCGTEAAGLISGGSADPGLVSTQNEYNGASWTAGGALLTALSYQNNNGTQTSCQIIGGGTPSYTTAVTNYDGTSVSTAPSLATARGYGRGTTTSGAVTGAIITSGSIPPQPSSNTSEEFTAATESVAAKTLTTS